MPAIIAILIIGAGIQLFFVYIDTTGPVLLLLLTLGPIIYGTIWCTFHPYWKAVKAYEKAAGAFITPNALVVQDLPQLPMISVQGIVEYFLHQDALQQPTLSIPEWRWKWTSSMYKSYIANYAREVPFDLHARQQCAVRVVNQALQAFLNALPSLPKGILSAPVGELVDAPRVMSAIIAPFWADDCHRLHVGDTLRATYSNNRAAKLPNPLWNTPFDGLLSLPYAFGIDGDVRFEHQWLVAPSGTGKTTFLKEQILHDLEAVALGNASVVVIDSQNVLIPEIAKLQTFAPGGKLHGKLVLLEPDPDYPLALNMFDMGSGHASERARLMHQASVLELVKFSLATMNRTQDSMLSYVVQLALRTPSPTLNTLLKILEPGGIAKFKTYLSRMRPRVQEYFANIFPLQSSAATREAVYKRISDMLDNEVFEHMFMSPVCKFSMFDEMNAGKVILVNTDLELMKKDACQTFGRYFIALLLQATERRGTGQIPTYCYIDECADYIGEDENIAEMLDKARKRKVGIVLAHQRMAQIRSANVIDALSNVAIRLAGGNEADAPYLSKLLRVDSEFISNQPRGSFALWMRNKITKAVSVRVEPDNPPLMSEEAFSRLRQDMRQRYCTLAIGWEPPDPEADDEELVYEQPVQAPPVVKVAELPDEELVNQDAVELVAEPPPERRTSEELRDAILASQGSIILPLWPKFEAACIGVGAFRIVQLGDREEMRLDFSKLQSILSPHQVERLRTLRRLRNNPNHHPPVPIPNIEAWAREVQMFNDILVKLKPADPAAASPER